jgi:hypothetical protein
MRSATVDQMVVQVAGAMMISVLGVVWLWVADVRRWWPFNYDAAVEALLAHGVESSAAQVQTAPGFETAHGHHVRRQRAGLRWAARVAARGERRLASRGEHTRRGLRRSARTLVLVS